MNALEIARNILLVFLIGLGASVTCSSQLPGHYGPDESASIAPPVYGAAAPLDPAILPNDVLITPKFDRQRISQRCLAGELDRNTCKFHWRNALAQELFHVSTEQAWNVATNSHIRDNLREGHFVDYWFRAVENFRFSRWKDDNDFLDDYIGHGMMGAISADIYIQNDPRSMTLVFDNSKNYWKSRLRAFAWSAVYSLQWKLGPLSEASIGY
jgi:hypothetical protein